MTAQLDPRMDRSHANGEMVRAALQLAGAWPDLSTADVTWLLADSNCTADRPCTTTALAFWLTDAAGTPIVESDRLVWPGPEPQQLQSVFLVLCRHGGAPVKVAGKFAATPIAAYSLANAVRVAPVLLRRAMSADPVELVDDQEVPGIRPPPTASAGSVRSVLRRWTRSREWRVAVAQDASLDDMLRGRLAGPMDWIRPRSWRRFWADPCPVIGLDGARWVFVEEYDRLAGRGCIAGLRLRDGVIIERRIVLEDRHHRALPRIQEVDGRWLATTDTCEYPSRVYTFEHPGDRWRADEGAILPGFLSDPELIRTPDGWTVTGTNWLEDDNAASETWTSPSGPPFEWTRRDELGYADAAVARNAGTTDLERGVRIAQDSAMEYGRNIVIGRFPRSVDQLPRSGARAMREYPDRPGGVGGAHTLAWTAGARLVATDIWWDRFDPFARLWLRRDQRHLSACRAGTKTAHSSAWVLPD
ncbi:MAG: hypothetical protein ACOYD0_06490 [Candidatus Nanopelagicales bacterium]